MDPVLWWSPASVAPLKPSVVRCSRLWTRSLIDAELDALVACFEGIARVSYQKAMSIISLICNVERTSEILERVRDLALQPGCCVLSIALVMVHHARHMA